MRSILLTVIVILSGCQTIPDTLLRTADEIQADNDAYWQAVDNKKRGIEELVVQPEVTRASYELEVYPLGP